MKRGVPLHSPEGRCLVNRGPAWREHPDYYAEEPFGEIPWHTEADVDLSVRRMRNYVTQERWEDMVLSDDDWRNLARVALGMRPQ